MYIIICFIFHIQFIRTVNEFYSFDKYGENFICLLDMEVFEMTPICHYLI
jgi:hypothetical protein